MAFAANRSTPTVNAYVAPVSAYFCYARAYVESAILDSLFAPLANSSMTFEKTPF